MKKTIKMLTAVIVAALAAVSLVFLVACGGESNTNTTPTTTEYKVTVQYPDGKAVNGTTEGTGRNGIVSVNFCQPVDNGMCIPVPLGADGTATLSDEDLNDMFPDGNVTRIHVELLTLPTGYTAEDFYLTPEEPSKTVTLTAVVPVLTYEVSVTFPTGAGITDTTFADAKVRFSDADTGHTPVDVNIVNGKATTTSTALAALTTAPITVTVTGLDSAYKVRETKTVSATSLTATLEVVAIEFVTLNLTPNGATLNGATGLSATFTDGHSGTYTTAITVADNKVLIDKDLIDAELNMDDTISVVLTGKVGDYKPTTTAATLSGDAATIEFVAITYATVTVNMPNNNKVGASDSSTLVVVFTGNSNTEEVLVVDGEAKIDVDDLKTALDMTDISSGVSVGIKEVASSFPTDTELPTNNAVVLTSNAATLTLKAVEYFDIAVLDTSGNALTTAVELTFLDSSEATHTTTRMTAADGTLKVKMNEIFAACGNATSVNVYVSDETVAENGQKGVLSTPLTATNANPTSPTQIRLQAIVYYRVTINYERTGVTALSLSGLKVLFSNPGTPDTTHSVDVVNGIASIDVDIISGILSTTTPNVKIDTTSIPNEYEIASSSENGANLSSTDTVKLTDTLLLASKGFYKLTVMLDEETPLGPADPGSFLDSIPATPYYIVFSNPEASTETYRVALGTTASSYTDGIVQVDVRLVNAAITSNTINVAIEGQLPLGYAFPTGITLSDTTRELEITLETVKADIEATVANNASYDFTTTRSGIYGLAATSVSGYNIAVYNSKEEFEKGYNGNGWIISTGEVDSYIFGYNAGDTLTFWCDGVSADTKFEFYLIKEGGAYELYEGTATVSSLAAENYTFTGTGSYTITISLPEGVSSSDYEAYLWEKKEGLDTTTVSFALADTTDAQNYSYSFTLEDNDTRTFYVSIYDLGVNEDLTASSEIKAILIIAPSSVKQVIEIGNAQNTNITASSSTTTVYVTRPSGGSPIVQYVMDIYIPRTVQNVSSVRVATTSNDAYNHRVTISTFDYNPMDYYHFTTNDLQLVVGENAVEITVFAGLEPVTTNFEAKISTAPVNLIIDATSPVSMTGLNALVTSSGNSTYNISITTDKTEYLMVGVLVGAASRPTSLTLDTTNSTDHINIYTGSILLLEGENALTFQFIVGSDPVTPTTYSVQISTPPTVITVGTQATMTQLNAVVTADVEGSYTFTIDAGVNTYTNITVNGASLTLSEGTVYTGTVNLSQGTNSLVFAFTGGDAPASFTVDITAPVEDTN